MADEIYVGFAVDGNKAANKINNLSTAKFSNIQINKEFTYVNYELTHITTKGEGYAAAGQDFTAKLVSDDGYNLPESIKITAAGKELAQSDYTYDKETGNVVIPADKIPASGTVVINAAADKKENIEYTLQTYGDTANLTVKEDGTSMTISQTAESSSMVSKKGNEGSNVSYLLFPSSDGASLSLIHI